MLLGPSFRVTAARGTPMPWPDVAYRAMAVVPPSLRQAVATVHPSAVLRADNSAAAYDAFVADLRVVASCMASAAG